jgi:hypothetical protein
VGGARGSPFERPHAEHRGHRTGCWKRWRHALFNSSGDGRIAWVAKARCRLTDLDELFVGSLVERRSAVPTKIAGIMTACPLRSGSSHQLAQHACVNRFRRLPTMSWQRSSRRCDGCLVAAAAGMFIATRIA